MTLFENAIVFAVHCHEGTLRKKERIPYIIHPMEVSSIASTMSHDEQVLAAALLHDTIEDTATTIEDIEENFGKRVAELVMSETEDKHAERPAEETWMQRKKESLEELRNTDDRDVKILWLSDKLSNMRSFHRLFVQQGDQMWDGFHQKDPKIQAWYYRTIRELVSELDVFDAWKEYSELVDKVFGEE